VLLLNEETAEFAGLNGGLFTALAAAVVVVVAVLAAAGAVTGLVFAAAEEAVASDAEVDKA
jgi:hypothetical protein